MNEAIPQSALRAVIVAPRYFPTVGGVQNHTYQLGRRLARDGVAVTILTTNPDQNLPAEEWVEGVRVLRVPFYPRGRDYYFAPAMSEIIRQGKWDIVHIQSYHTLVAPMAMFAAQRAGIPYVVTLHGGGHSSPLRSALRGVHQRALGPLLAHADRLIATARFEPGFFGKMLGLPMDQFVYIPNGGDLPELMEPPSRPADHTLIISIGRLERYKGHHKVIAALPHLLQARPDIRLWVAGAGEYEAELRQLAARLGVADKVRIESIPPTNRQAMAIELSKAHLVCSLSAYETHPMAVLEAIALGCSVLVANSPGLNELAQDGFARAIPHASTPEQIAQAMLKQLAEPLQPPSLRLSSWDECSAKVLHLYQSIVCHTGAS